MKLQWSGCIVRVVIVVKITEIVMSVFTSRTNYNKNEPEGRI